MKPDETDLRDALRSLARTETPRAARPHVEETVMRAWDVGHADAPARWGMTWKPSARLAVAASFLLAAGLGYVLTLPSGDTSIEMPAVETTPQVEPAWPSDDTLAWIDPDPASLQIVRLRVESAALIAQGYPVSDPDGDGTIDIEMILGVDGMARSVRVAHTAVPIN